MNISGAIKLIVLAFLLTIGFFFYVLINANLNLTKMDKIDVYYNINQLEDDVKKANKILAKLENTQNIINSKDIR